VPAAASAASLPLLATEPDTGATIRDCGVLADVHCAVATVEVPPSAAASPAPAGLGLALGRSRFWGLGRVVAEADGAGGLARGRSQATMGSMGGACRSLQLLSAGHCVGGGTLQAEPPALAPAVPSADDSDDDDDDAAAPALCVCGSSTAADRCGGSGKRLHGQHSPEAYRTATPSHHEGLRTDKGTLIDVLDTNMGGWVYAGRLPLAAMTVTGRWEKRERCSCAS
jgi:hypothetical protein